MSENFDPYLQWLGIRDPERPPNYYRLLGVELFESDPIVLTNAVDRQMAHVRNFQAGKHSAQSQKILNELAAAKLCLLNPQRKAQYDVQLQAQQAAAGQVLPSAGSQPGAAPAAPSAAGLWPSGARANQAPQPTQMEASDPATAYSSPSAAPADQSSPWFSIVISVLMALILILLGLIVFIATRKGDQDQTTAVETVEPATTPKSVPEPKPKPKPEPKPPVKPETKPAAKPEVKPKTKPATTPGPKPKTKPKAKPETKPSPKPQTKPKVSGPTVAESIEAARKAMADRDLAAARHDLDQAHNAAVMGSQEADEVNRLHVILTCLEYFAKALDKGIAALRPGDQLKVGGLPATVTSMTDGQVVLKVGSQERRLSSKNLPPEIALAVASRSLPKDTGTSLSAKVAFLVFDPNGDLDLAERLCVEAAEKNVLKPELSEEWKRAYAERGGKKSAPVATAPKRLPVPDKAAQAKILAEVRDLFAKEYAAAEESTENKKKLAKTLLAQAPQTKDNPTARYVLLIQARDLAVDGGDASSLDKALSELSRVYEVDRLTMASELLTDAAKRGRPSAANRAMAQAALNWCGVAMAQDQFDTASELVDASIAMARRAGDMTTVKKAVATKRDIEEMERRYSVYVAAGKALAANPDDARASRVCGTYLCFVKGDWEKGLPLLSKGDDPALATLAKAELAHAAMDPIEQAKDLVALGDKWWDAADSPNAGANREKFLARAAIWYREAAPGLTGLTRVKVQRRLDAIKPKGGSRIAP